MFLVAIILSMKSKGDEDKISIKYILIKLNHI